MDNWDADESTEKKPSRTDQRLLRLLSDRPIVLGRLGEFGVLGLLGLDGLSLSPISMGCWGWRVPTGGRSGSRLSKSICARDTVSLAGASSSSSSKGSGVSCALLWRLFEVATPTTTGGCCSACLRLRSVGVGEGGTGVTVSTGCMIARVKLRSKLAGRLRRKVCDDCDRPLLPNVIGVVSIPCGATGCCLALVRSSNAWLPLAPAATISMASSSLPRLSIQSSALESRSGDASLLFRGTEVVGARAFEVERCRVRAKETTEVELRSWGRESETLLYGGGRPAGSWEGI